MLFEKSLRRDLVNLAGVVFAALFTILVTTTLVRTLGRAAVGRVDTASILPLLAFFAINAMPVLLVLTLYIAVLMALTRAYRDAEMVIWFASGRSLTDFVMPVMRFAFPLVVVVAVLSFSLAPWANQQSAETLRRAGRLQTDLKYGRIDEILATGLHAYLTQFLDRVGELGVGISRDFLVPIPG
jgi:lipopolysaccharide export system permease protein